MTGQRPPWDRKAKVKTMAIGLVPLIAGLTFVIASAVSRAHMEDKKAELRGHGTEVLATVTDTSRGARGGTDQFQVSYNYGGAGYATWIRCAGVTGCASFPGPRIRIWLDPAHPDEFVAENNNTDDSLSPLNSWVVIPIGSAFALMGLFVAALPVVSTLVVRRRRRLGLPVRSTTTRAGGPRRKPQRPSGDNQRR
jgi:hypothetical protein